MDEKILDSLIQILQKHANAIRKLQVANIALMELVRQDAENSGTPYEEFEKRFLTLLSSVEQSRLARGQDQSIANEIEETVEMLALLAKQRGKPN